MALFKTDSSIHCVTREYSQYLVVTKWEVTFKNYIKIFKNQLKNIYQKQCVMLKYLIILSLITLFSHLQNVNKKSYYIIKECSHYIHVYVYSKYISTFYLMLNLKYSMKKLIHLDMFSVTFI